MNLNPRARIKVKAALSLIALHGHNPRPVQQKAQAHFKSGLNADQAYTLALNEFADRLPAIRPMLEIAMDLIQKSDEPTLEAYDATLSAYNDSGDESHLEAIAPMVLEDAKALAVLNGATADDVSDWDIYDALGYEDGASAEVPDVPDIAAPMEGAAPAQAQPSQFQFQSPTPQAHAARPAAQPQQASQQPQQAPQYAPGWSATGYSPARARAAQQAQSGNAGRPQTQAEYNARKWADAPVGVGNFIKTASGYRPVPTGEKARQEAGVPLGPNV